MFLSYLPFIYPKKKSIPPCYIEFAGMKGFKPKKVEVEAKVNINDLPNDVLISIATFVLSNNKLPLFLRVCKRWYNLKHDIINQSRVLLIYHSLYFIPNKTLLALHFREATLRFLATPTIGLKNLQLDELSTTYNLVVLNPSLKAEDKIATYFIYHLFFVASLFRIELNLLLFSEQQSKIILSHLKNSNVSFNATNNLIYTFYYNAVCIVRQYVLYMEENLIKINHQILLNIILSLFPKNMMDQSLKIQKVISLLKEIDVKIRIILMSEINLGQLKAESLNTLSQLIISNLLEDVKNIRLQNNG